MPFMKNAYACRRRIAKLWLAVSLLLSAVLPTSSKPVAAAPLDGTWRSQGYGYVFEFHGSAVQAFEVTETTCVRSFSAKRDTREVNGIEATFRGPDELVLFVESGGTTDRRLLQIESSSSFIRIDRILRKPEVCDHLTANTPIGNFDVFAQTWAEHYISFELKHSDWSKVVAETGPKLQPQRHHPSCSTF
jgi:hypothetical protein